MNEFLKVLWSLSVSGTLLLLLILGLRPLYRDTFSRGWQYYIWLIVVLRFLLPVTPDTAIVGRLFDESDTMMIRSLPERSDPAMEDGRFDKSGTMIITDEDSVDPDRTVSAHAGGSESGQDGRKAITGAAQDPQNLYTGLFFIWAVPALILFIRKILRYQSFIRYLRAGNTEISDPKTLQQLSDCEKKLKIKAGASLYDNASVASPMMNGFFHPDIVLPAKELEEKELSYILMHELVHYKQKDLFYKWLIQAVVCIHWFNPFVYLLEKEVNRCCELACDEKVLSMLDGRSKREYGDMLISFLKSVDQCKSSLGSVTLSEGAEQVKERLGAIMKFRKKTRSITMFSFVTVLLLAVFGYALGAYAAQPVSGEKKADLTGYTAAWEDMLLIHEGAGVFYYEDGNPYIQDVLTNHTDKCMVETEYCMLAYDGNGSPLKLYWNFLDSSAKSSYENMVRSGRSILPGQTKDPQGGWSLYDGEQMEYMPKTENGETAQIAYVLFCLKQVVFEDGTVWNNPDYEEWFEAYAGQEIGADRLENYYPYEYRLGSD